MHMPFGNQKSLYRSFTENIQEKQTTQRYSAGWAFWIVNQCM